MSARAGVLSKALSNQPSSLFMNQKKCAQILALSLLIAAVGIPAVAQEKKAESPASASPSEADMMAMMMQMSKPGENHQLLAKGVGKWDYKVKFWMAPGMPPSESTGSSVVRPVMGGRYFISEHNGKMQMPGADGKMTELAFNGMATDGYDNVKKKFVSSWIDNMGTSIMQLEGTYDPATKTFTYVGEEEAMPGTKTKVRQLIKCLDNDHRLCEFYEDQGTGKETKTMEIAYTRSKS